MNVEVQAEEFFSKVLKTLGELIINEIKLRIRDMGLISPGGGSYLQNWFSTVNGDTITIENTQGYAVYLEFGTYQYWNSFGMDNFPDTPHPKKKDVGPSIREILPKGMQPFAPVRRVIYNKNVMERLLQQAFEN